MDLVTLAIAATPAFIASAVEFVEATTIVLAVGITRGWRAPLAGSALAALTLAVIVGTLGEEVFNETRPLIERDVKGGTAVMCSSYSFPGFTVFSSALKALLVHCRSDNVSGLSR